MTTSVIYFPPKQGAKAGYLGGGYITSGTLKTRFNVRSSTKNKFGIWVTLPTRKNEQGEWIDEVEFVNKEAAELVEGLVYAEMQKQGVNTGVAVDQFAGGGNTAPTTRQATPPTSTVQVVSRAQPTGIPTKPPF